MKDIIKPKPKKFVFSEIVKFCVRCTIPKRGINKFVTPNKTSRNIIDKVENNSSFPIDLGQKIDNVWHYFWAYVNIYLTRTPFKFVLPSNVWWSKLQANVEFD